MGAIEWAMWGNEQGVGSSFVLLLGGVLAVAGQFKRWQFGAYAIPLSVAIFIIEYPRSIRAKGRATKLRWAQKIPSTIVEALGPVGRNYYCRFVVYMLACIPCVFQLSTVLGALSLLLTGIIYLKAALNGEKWSSGKKTEEKVATRIPSRGRPPSMAPPRLKKKGIEEGDNNDELYENVKTGRGSRI